MNRELKFRTWVAKDQKMSVSRDLESWFNAFCQFEHDTRSDFNISLGETIWMQYTGLKDKNNVEVYHGDILQMYRHSDDTHKHEPSTVWAENRRISEVREVKYQCGTFYLDSIYGGRRTFMSLARPGESFEVIGNIWENADLLEPKP